MSTNIFGNSTDEHKEVRDKVDTHSKTILSVIQRQKDLESNFDHLSEKFGFLDHNSITNFKKAFLEIKELREDIRQVKTDLNKLKEQNQKIVKQLKLTAQVDEVKKLEKYIDLWEPLNFVTRDELNEKNQKLKEDIAKIIEEFLNK